MASPTVGECQRRVIDCLVTKVFFLYPLNEFIVSNETIHVQ